MRIAIFFILAVIFTISPIKEYGWFMGSIHGALAPYNWIISWFDPCLVQAPLHTTAYGVFWWIAMIGSAIDLAINVIMFIVGLISSIFNR